MEKEKNSSVKSNKRKGGERGKEQIKSLSGETFINTKGAKEVQGLEI